MRLSTDTSDIYRKSGKALYLIEGRCSKKLNSYFRNNTRIIKAYLAKRGVHLSATGTVSPGIFGSRSIKSLILRQIPTASVEELKESIRSIKRARKEKGSSIYFISPSFSVHDCNTVTIIAHEEDLGRSNDYETELFGILDRIALIEKKNTNCYDRGTAGKFMFSIPTEKNIPEEERICLETDILAQAIYDKRSKEISPIHIDNRFNILLPLYPQIKIKLDPLPKSLYILFLRHPEGIYLKEIGTYLDELKTIYSAVSGRQNPTVITRMLKNLTDPTENTLHKNLTIIRKCFMDRLNYETAKNYFPAYGRKEAHYIPLDKEFIHIPEILR